MYIRKFTELKDLLFTSSYGVGSSLGISVPKDRVDGLFPLCLVGAVTFFLNNFSAGSAFEAIFPVLGAGKEHVAVCFFFDD